MKSGIKFLVLAIFCFLTSNLKAQFDSTLNGELRRLLLPLNRAACPSPFLFDMAAHFTNDTFYTIRSYDTSNARNWYNLYFEFNAMSYSPGIIPSDTLIEDAADEIYRAYSISGPTTVQTGKVPLGLMDFDYNSIRPDAFDSANYGRWFFWDNDTIWDNPGRSSEPFESNLETPGMGTCKEIFAFSPLIENHFYRNVIFTIDPGQFFFYNSTYSGNVFPHPSPHTFQIDFGDGGGWRTVDPYNYSEISILYPDSGTYYTKARVLMDAVVIKHSLSIFHIQTNMIERLPDINFEYPHVNVGVYKGCSSDGLLKPLVFISGIDIMETRHIPEIYAKTIIDPENKQLIGMLKNYDYDIVIIDWKDSKIDMRTNASAVVNVLDYLKTISDTTHQFVVVGESMGGVIGRYALTYMETSTYFSTGSPTDKIHFRRWRGHNTRLFISADAPHQGAIIPLAFQHATDWIYRVPRPLIRSVAYLYSQFKNAEKIQRNFIKRDAVRQLFILHRDTRNGSAEYTSDPMREEFMDDLEGLNPATNGWPEHCKLVGFSNGLLDGSFQVAYKDTIIQPNDILLNANMFLGIRIFKVIPIPLFAMDDSKLRINPQGSGNIVEMGWRFNLGNTITSVSSFPFGLIWSLKGCLTNLFKKKSCPCNVLGVGFPFTVDINNAEPWERYPGGTEYGLDTKNEKKDKYYKCWLSYNLTDYDPFNGTYTIKRSIGPRFLLSGNFNLNITSQVPRFCFIPMQSALDYRGFDAFGNQLPQNHNINSNSASVNMLRTPFDVILGWNQSAIYPKTIYYGSNGYGYRRQNASHMAFRNESIFNYNGLEPIEHGIINREIGDREMYLDNMNINHEAFYQASDKIIAGIHESPYYLYPDQSPSPTMVIEGLFSDSGKFVVDSFSTPGEVAFKAEDEIILRPGFEARYNSKFHAFLGTMLLCEYTLENIGDMVYIPPSPAMGSNDTNTVVSVTEVKVEGKQFKLFPNPSSLNVSVWAENSTITKGFIIDLNGRIVSCGISNENYCEFNIGNLSPGIYICVVECEGHAYKFKVVKQ